MNTEEQASAISKFLSLILRHKPEIVGLELDKNGWADVETLITKVNNTGRFLNKEILAYVVANNPKKRFAFNEQKEKIRANQGHSIEVELGYTPQMPPEILLHGTSEQTKASILTTGIQKQKRHHVHLSQDAETAKKVGERHGKLVLFEVSAGQMHQSGFVFYLSENNVWLTESVPVQYLKIRS